MEHEQRIEQMRLLRGILPVGAEHREDGLRRALLGAQGVHEEGLVIEMLALDLVGIDHQDRHPRDQGDGRPHLGLEGSVLAVVLVVGIQREHGACELVHDVVGRRLHHHIHHEAGRKWAVHGEIVVEGLELVGCRELAEEQQIDRLLIAEAAVLLRALDEVADVVAAVDQLAGDRLHLALIDHIAVDVTDVGDACEHARPIGTAQTALDMELGIQRLVDARIFAQRLA